MKVHYWDGKHGAVYLTACGKICGGGIVQRHWPFKYWQQRKWKGVTCKGCLNTRRKNEK